jgi:hypothetical protein
VHDLCYHFGSDEWDKRYADRLLLLNLLIAVDDHCMSDGIINRTERVILREAAFIYYRAVSDWGKGAFYSNKYKKEGINHG